MEKTKKKGLLKVAGLMAAATLLTTCVVSGAMAKYTSSGSVTGGKVTVAEWSITANDNNLSTGVGALTWNILKEGTENGVSTDSVTADRIAPGTWGYAQIKITNESEVAATLTVTGFTAPSEDSIGLEFGCTYTTSEQNTYANISGANAVSGLSDVALAKGASICLYIYYQWSYTGDDTHDTELGEKVTRILALSDLTITATQAPYKVE